ncbi:CPBP family intramembrane metalloprotease [Candidatus Saccharibacteria bacterium]|nr:CPBP family intramembrane metalloprotease [Candidatus Saccharibacteria bacterium]
MNWLKAILSKTKKYDPISAIVVTIAGYFLSQIGGVAVLIILSIFLGWDSGQIVDKLSDSPWVSLVFTLSVYGFYIAIIKSFLKWCRTSLESIGLKMTKDWYDIPGFALAGYGAYFLFAIMVTALVEKGVTNVDLNQKQELGFNTYASGFELLPIFIALVIIPPVVEEIVTRGFLYTGLRKKFNVLWSGMITSIIFAAAHLQWGGDAPLLWAAAIDTFILSWVLIYLREKTGSIYPAIGLHMIKNFMAFLALFIFHVA